MGFGLDCCALLGSTRIFDGSLIGREVDVVVVVTKILKCGARAKLSM